MTDNYPSFTHQTRQALNASERAAGGLKHDSVGPEHILIGLMREKDGAAFGVIQHLGIDPEEICKAVEKSVKTGTRPAQSLTVNRDTKHVLELAVDEAHRIGNPYIATYHLLLAILRYEKKGILRQKNITTDVLKQFHVDYNKAEKAVKQLLEEGVILEISENTFTNRMMGLFMSSREEHISVIENTVKICGSVLSTISQEQALAKRAANGQTVLQLLGHMAGYGEYIHQCGVRMLEEEYPQLEAYDFDEVNIDHNEQGKDALYTQMLQSRSELAKFFRRLSDEQWARAGMHPEYYDFSLLDLFVRFIAMDVSRLEELTRIITTQ